jgi:hypothetical protein
LVLEEVDLELGPECEEEVLAEEGLRMIETNLRI